MHRLPPNRGRSRGTLAKAPVGCGPLLSLSSRPARQHLRPGSLWDGDMMERLSQAAQRALVGAHSQARDLRHERVGSGHILLGLICQEPTLTSHILLTAGIAADRVRQHVVEILGEGHAVGSRAIPLTSEAKAVLTRGEEEANAAGEGVIATYHLLLGVLSSPDSVGARVIRVLGGKAEQIRGRLASGLLHAEPEEAVRPMETQSRLEYWQREARSSEAGTTDELCSFCGQAKSPTFGCGPPRADEAFICADCLDLFQACAAWERGLQA